MIISVINYILIKWRRKDIFYGLISLVYDKFWYKQGFVFVNNPYIVIFLSVPPYSRLALIRQRLIKLVDRLWLALI